MKEEASKDEYIQAEVVEQVDFDKPKDPLWKRLLNRVRRTVEDDEYEAEIARREALGDADLLAELREEDGYSISVEASAHERVLSSWQDPDPDVFTCRDIAHWAYKMREPRHEEYLGPYFRYADQLNTLTEKTLQGGVWFRGNDRDVGMMKLRKMARALREPGVDIDDHMPYPE